MKLLCLDTSSRYGSLALCEGGSLVAELTMLGGITQTERLVPLLERLLQDVGWKPADLEGYAVVRGPGSFTGIRVGLATIQGLVLASQKPAVGFSALEALAWGLPHAQLPVVSVLDARQGEVYAAQYRWQNGLLQTELEPCVMPPARVASRLTGAFLLVGDGAPLLARALQDRPEVQPVLLEGSSALLRASTLAGPASRRLATAAPGALLDLEPLYLRASNAEEKRAASLAQAAAQA